LEDSFALRKYITCSLNYLFSLRPFFYATWFSSGLAGSPIHTLPHPCTHPYTLTFTRTCAWQAELWRCGAPAMVAFALLHVLPKDLALESPQQCASAIEALVHSANLCPPLYDQWVCKILFNTRLWAYGTGAFLFLPLSLIGSPSLDMAPFLVYTLFSFVLLRYPIS